MLNHFHRRLGRLRQLLHRGRWHCGLPRLCRRRGGVGGHVWRQVATVAVLGRYAPGGGDGGQLQNRGCMENLWMNGKRGELKETAGIIQDSCNVEKHCKKNKNKHFIISSLSFSYVNSQERPSSVKSEKGPPTWHQLPSEPCDHEGCRKGCDVEEMQRKDKSTPCYRNLFLHGLLGGLPCTSQVPCHGFILQQKVAIRS